MPESPIPLAEGQKASADDSGAAARVVINWMVDSNESLRVRPGISNSTLDPGRYNAKTGTSTGIAGMYVWRSVFDSQFYLVYVRADRQIYAKNLVTNLVTSLSSTDVTTQLQGSMPPVFAEDSLRLVIAGGGALQQWTGAGLSSRLATYTVGVNQPPTAASHVVNVGNYLVANGLLTSAANQLFWSNLGDGSHASWSPLNFNTADADPDPIVALGASQREVAAFGTKTLQIFGLSVDANLPFSSTAALSLGCGAPYSVIRRDHDFAWLDDARRFVASDGRAYSVLSDDINKLVRDFGTVSDGFGFRARLSFWDLLVWIFPTEGKAFAFDMKRNDWRPWRGWNGVDDYAAIRISSYAPYPAGNMHIVGDPQFENLWTLDDKVFSDTGPSLPIVAERVTQRLDFDSAARKRTQLVRFFLKRGQTSNSASEPAMLDVAKKDDDNPWSGQARIDLGQQGDYSSFKDWRPGGVYHRRQFRIRYSGGVDTSLTKAVEFWTPQGEGAG